MRLVSWLPPAFRPRRRRAEPRLDAQHMQVQDRPPSIARGLGPTPVASPPMPARRLQPLCSFASLQRRNHRPPFGVFCARALLLSFALARAHLRDLFSRDLSLGAPRKAVSGGSTKGDRRVGSRSEVVAMGADVAPRARKSTTLRFLFELEKPDGLLPGTAKLPPPVPEPEADSLIDKIDSCSRLFTFVDGECVEERDAKGERLGEVLAAVKSSGGKQHPLDHRVMVALVKMVGANLFRTLPPSACPSLPPDGADEDAAVMVLSPAWPHLQVVYDILLAVVTAADARTLRNHVDRSFLSNLLALFASEDPRERDRLKTAYHQLYSKLTCERAFMRRSMSAAFLRFVHETAPAERHCGVAELLEICGSIINGFAVPLKEEHRAFLARVLLPLHRTRWVHTYHRQLAYCVLQFVHKEPELADAVVRGILRHWPVTNCQKEVLLIEELEEILELLEPKQFAKLAVPLCSRIARCVSSCSSQVAERALYVWNNERFLELASASPCVMEAILPAFVASVESNLEQHWSKCVQQVTASVKALLQRVAPDLYERCVDDLDSRRSEAEAAAAVRDERWRKVEMAAAANNVSG